MCESAGDGSWDVLWQHWEQIYYTGNLIGGKNSIKQEHVGEEQEVGTGVVGVRQVQHTKYVSAGNSFINN